MNCISKAVLSLILGLCLFFGGRSLVRRVLQSRKTNWKRNTRRQRQLLSKTLCTTHELSLVVGFFHPYCNAGGGGERVLWAAIRATQTSFPNVLCVVYSGDVTASKEEVIQRAHDAFGIDVDPSRMHLISLHKRYLVSPSQWPRFTLIGQSLGSVPLVWEAMSAFVPDIFIDTMGYAFTYPVVQLVLGIPVASYTHYPTISSDMLAQVTYRNVCKQVYWRAFAKLYAYAGSFTDLAMANSTWTMNHLKSLWQLDDSKIRVVYPPCDTSELMRADTREARRREIVCVAQFRPEKNHAMLLAALQELLERSPELHKNVKLILIGTVRNDEDLERVASLKRLTSNLGLQGHVDFRLNVPWPDVVTTISAAWIGTNAMWNEHFGIGVVEYMAAGLISVVHDSAGPKLDIVTPYKGLATGFHGTDAASFARAFEQAFALTNEDCQGMRRRAQCAAARFSEEVFDGEWKRTMAILMRHEKELRSRRKFTK